MRETLTLIVGLAGIVAFAHRAAFWRQRADYWFTRAVRAERNGVPCVECGLSAVDAIEKVTR